MKKKTPTFAEKVKRVRTLIDLTQEQFAEMSGISTSLLSKIETGSSPSDKFRNVMLTKWKCLPFFLEDNWPAGLNFDLDDPSDLKGIFHNGELPLVNRPILNVSNENSPYREALIARLRDDAETWKQKYEQAWTRLEWLMERMPLGKWRPVSSTALRMTGSD